MKKPQLEKLKQLAALINIIKVFNEFMPYEQRINSDCYMEITSRADKLALDISNDKKIKIKNK